MSEVRAVKYDTSEVMPGLAFLLSASKQRFTSEVSGMRPTMAHALYELHLEMLQLLANALSDAEGWSAKDEDRAREIVRAYL